MPVFCQRGFACGETARAVIGPAFWVCRAKSGAAFRCAKPPCAVVRFAAMTSSPRTSILPFPSRLRRAGSPTAKTRPLLPFGRISPAAKPGRPVVAPAGGNVLATPFSLRSNVAPRSHPGPPRFQLGFCCAKTGGRVPPLSDGGALTKSENIILCASSCHPPRSPYPHCTLPRVRFSGIGQKKKPQRKTAAAVNTLYMSCKKTSVNPISFPVALCTKISPFKAIQLLSQCKTKIQFLWMRMRKRSAN